MKTEQTYSTATAVRQIAVIVLVAAFLSLPVWLVGIPQTGDGSTHVGYLYHFSQQFWHGDFYPRWLAGSNKGYGAPIFLVQYPFPYFVAALLRPITWFFSGATKESHELGLYCLIVLVAAGLAARTWFRSRYSPLASTIAAVLYISLPYIVGQTIYERASLGELAAFVWMPLILLLCDKLQPVTFKVLSGIGVLFALLVWSNVLTAALFAPVMVLYPIFSEEQSGRPLVRRVVRRVVPMFGALVIGVLVGAAYIFPMLAYHRLFDAGAVPRNHPVAELGRSLVSITRSDWSNYHIIIPGEIVAICLMLFVARYVWRADAGLVRRLLVLGVLAAGAAMLIPGFGPKLIQLSGLKVTGFDSYNGFVARMLFTLLFTAVLGLLAYCRVSREGTDRREQFLLAVCCVAFVLMLPWTAILWKTIPVFGDVIQFPWRLCAVLTVAASGLFAAAVDDSLRQGAGGGRRPSLIVMLSAAVVVIIASNMIWRVDQKFRHPSTPHLDLTRDVDPMYNTYVPASDLVAFAKSVGTSPETWQVAPTSYVEGVRADLTGSLGSVRVTRVGPRKLLVSVQSEGNAVVRIGQLNFPLWRIVPADNGPGDESLGTSGGGLIEVSLGPGKHDFWLIFDGGRPERWGDVVTLVSVVLVAAGLIVAALTSGQTRKDAHKHLVSS
jgi:uncharacterized membrane protein SirB2